MEKPILSFPVISDIHISVENVQSHQKCKHALQDLYNISPDYDVLVVNGDMTNDGTQESYDKLTSLVEENLEKEIFFTIGNHEFFKDDGNKAAINRYLHFTGTENVFYEKSVKGYPFIFLGSENWGPTDSPTKDSAVLSVKQLTWLEETLSKYEQSTKPIFVFLHQPIPYTLTGTDIPYYEKSIIQSEELTNILKKYEQVIYFSGHTHWDLRMSGMCKQDQFTMVSTGSVFSTWGPDGNDYEEVVDVDGSQGLFVEVYEDKVLMKGRDFTKKQWIEAYSHKVKIK